MHAASIGEPKKKRKNYPCTIRVDGAEDCDDKHHDSSHNKYVLAAEDEVNNRNLLL